MLWLTKYCSKAMCTHSKWANEQILNSPKWLTLIFFHDIIQVKQKYAACYKKIKHMYTTATQQEKIILEEGRGKKSTVFKRPKFRFPLQFLFIFSRLLYLKKRKRKMGKRVKTRTLKMMQTNQLHEHQQWQRKKTPTLTTHKNINMAKNTNTYKVNHKITAYVSHHQIIDNSIARISLLSFALKFCN